MDWDRLVHWLGGTAAVGALVYVAYGYGVQEGRAGAPAYAEQQRQEAEARQRVIEEFLSAEPTADECLRIIRMELHPDDPSKWDWGPGGE